MFYKTSPQLFISILLLLASYFICHVTLAATVTTGIDEQAKLPYWELKDQGMVLRLVQRLPIQSRAFFLARGFNKQQAERIAQSCVFQTVFKNISDEGSQPGPLSYNLRDWKVVMNGKQKGLKVREDWMKEWQAEKVTKPVQLAFEWALYPTQQSYKAGDYNWGMSVFNLKPSSKFDLTVIWTQFGNKHKETIKNMECAADINPQPEEQL